MARSLRLSERWFNRGLWAVAFAFAFFLAGLGGVVVGDLPRVERPVQRESFIDQAAAAPLRASIEAATRNEAVIDDRLEQLALKSKAARQAYASAREVFVDWVATRKATGLPSQDTELIARTRSLDALKAEENATQHLVDVQQQEKLDTEQAQSLAQQRLDRVEAAANAALETAERAAELRVFLYRLALTLPLLGIAGWLFATRRTGTWWPFAWGFILFALYAFFVELVPYLPSYGGYVRFVVGIVVTVLVGRYAIVSLQRYLAQQRLAEQQPGELRRRELSYDVALARLAKSVCPSCERKVDLTSPHDDFCPHCGIGLFGRCPVCNARKSAFAQFCHSCGAAAVVKA